MLFKRQHWKWQAFLLSFLNSVTAEKQRFRHGEMSTNDPKENHRTVFRILPLSQAEKSRRDNNIAKVPSEDSVLVS